MPELPEVEIVVRGLAPVLEGARIARLDQRRPDLRFPFPERFAERLTGRTVRAMRRRAKYILAELDDDVTLLAHLGMTGRFLVSPAAPSGGEMRGGMPGVFAHEAGELERHDHVVIVLENGGRIVYNDARRFGFMTLIAPEELTIHPLLRDLGIEPLGNELNAGWLATAARGRSAPLKAFLLDQRIIAGLGNIYVSEVLFLARLNPERPASVLATVTGKPTAAANRLVPAIRTVIADAIAAGGSTLRDYRHADGSLGYFQMRFKVYDRAGEPCPRQGCDGRIARIVQSGRSTFHCRRCQR